ncbi:helix-turn-helix domain-containing protein [Bradyrhizobium sp. BR 10289]|uniref:helix-turn-helix domain-containing protein n=1 Tax=Bradyrhizobium sp. BR 10289 TaxID=2749993 RepID=UPI001C647218|nr:helix-turn-helix domain-containing protein [Bradyrhizobium sp. BR 10289]MBW7972490.1 helix-turn-helix domain-containing protein [Bradyrhizobium sp. BR 10289]
MDQGLFNIDRDGAQRTASDGLLSFQGLKPSAALELQSYEIDDFAESEQYAGASSMPLSAGVTAIKRARLNLPALSLFLVKTFPRILRGYDLAHAVAVAVPMDQVTSTRINGQSIGGSILVLKGKSDCLLYEPVGRLWAVAYFSPTGREPWSQLDDGYHLPSPAPDVLASLRRSMSNALETAAHDPDVLNDQTSRSVLERLLFATMDAAIRSSAKRAPARTTTDSYQRIVAEMERLIRHDLATWHKTTELAERVGVSVRTLQSATQAICGMSPHRYSRVLRLWSVRKLLRTGPAGRSVKACAIGHGFWHLSEFAASYRAAFGELPSETLHRAQREIV